MPNNKPFAVQIRWGSGRASPFPSDPRLLTKAHCELSGRLISANLDKWEFWLTNVASRQRHAGAGFDEFHDVVTAINGAAGAPDRLHRDRFATAAGARLACAIARRLGATARIGHRAEFFIAGMRAVARDGARYVYKVGQMTRAIWIARRLPAPDFGTDAHWLITLVYADHRRVKLDSPFHEDVYFGSLAEMASHRHIRVRFAAVCAQSEPAIMRIFADAPALLERVVPLLTLSTFGDLVRAVWLSISAPRRLRAPRMDYCGFDISALFLGDLRGDRAAMLANFMTARAARRFAAKARPRHVVHCYENNSWERGIYAELARAGVPVTGYLHCAVLSGHLTNYCTREEWIARPRPDRIVTTGADAAELLRGLGDYPDDAITPGAALRDSPDSDLMRAPAPQAGRVLVMLEGLISMTRFLRLVCEAAQARPELTVVVRAHPDLPANRIARAAGFDIQASRLRISEHGDIRQDIALAQVVLYQGTTAAITAGMMPRPLIRAALDARVDDDPLAGIDELKWQVGDLPGLLLALDEALATHEQDLESTYRRRAIRIQRRWSAPTLACVDALLAPHAASAASDAGAGTPDIDRISPSGR